MKKTAVAGVVLGLLLLVGGGIATWSLRPVAPRGGDPATPAAASNQSAPDAKARPIAAAGAVGRSDADRLARADKIRRDYDEMTTKFSADYAAAGNAFPGGLSAYLKQLALLQAERRKDLAALLTPNELEELEMRESSAGQTVQKLLSGTAASDEQRRAAFRAQKEFEDRFALTFDLSPAALATREAARQATQQKIRAVLGDEVFGAWLSGEGTDYAGFATFTKQQGLASSVALDLWRVKSEFTLARLQLKARTDLVPAQIAEADRVLASQALTRVTGLIGPAAVAGPGRELLTWLPMPPAR